MNEKMLSAQTAYLKVLQWWGDAMVAQRGGAPMDPKSLVDLWSNRIESNRAPEGAGVYCMTARPMLFNNWIQANENYYLPPVYFGSAAGAQSVEWHKTFETENPINPYNNPSTVRMAEDGYWVAYVADHHTAYNISHGDVRITRLDAAGEVTGGYLIAGNAAVMGLEAMGEYLDTTQRAGEKIRSHGYG